MRHHDADRKLLLGLRECRTRQRHRDDDGDDCRHGERPRDPGVDVSELAAYTSVTSLILNLNEVVMKE